MKILYLFRKSNTFSIEKVFQLINDELKLKYQTNSLKVYSKYEKPQYVLINILYIFVKRAIINRYDIIHVTGVIHYLVLFLPKNKTILTIHDCIKYYQHSGFSQIIIKYLWFKLPVSYLKYITVISKKTKDDLVKITNCNPNKILVIENPVSITSQTYFKDFDQKKPRILQIGTSPNKNLTRLIEALEGINCTLVIIGHINSNILELLAKLKTNYLNYTNLSDNEIVEEYRKCDIVSFVSTFEGFGVPIIEGQINARVVLTSNISPHKEVGSDGAYFVDPYSIQSIRDGVKVLIENNDLRNDLINKGLINAQKYNPKIIASRYENLYQFVQSNNKS